MSKDNHLASDLRKEDTYTVESEDDQLGDDTWEDWEDDESDRVKSLFSNDTFATVDEAVAFDAQRHNFDLNKYRSEIQASEYDTYKIINYIRSEVAAGRDVALHSSLGDHSDPAITQSKLNEPWQDDSYLIPVIENDELLFHDWEERPDEAMVTAEDMSTILDEMHAMALEDEMLRELLLAGISATETSQIQQNQDNSSRNNNNNKEIDASYFESYSFFGIHRDMLGDTVRTEAYQNALENNPNLIKNAIVLDVGCGTGILSMFAARGGASQVVGVDGSPEIAAVAQEICAKNGFTGESINILSSKIEELHELPVSGKVDVLVSEWMGYALLFESMLDSVLIARDKFLKPGGAILPDIANIYVAGAGFGATGLDFWDDVYGFDMSWIAEKLQESASKEAMVRVVDPKHIVTEKAHLISLDLVSMDAQDQDFSSTFTLFPSKNRSTCQQLHSLVLWFDVSFSEQFCASAPQLLPTSPWDVPTHWAQTVLPLRTPVEMAPSGRAVKVRGRVSMARRSGTHRMLDISVEYVPVYANGEEGPSHAQLYSMSVHRTTS